MVCSEETFQLGHMSNLYLTISLDTTWTFFKSFINFFILINLLLFYLFYIINDLLPVTSTFPKLGKNNAGDIFSIGYSAFFTMCLPSSQSEERKGGEKRGIRGSDDNGIDEARLT